MDPTDLESEYRIFAEAFGRALLARDFGGAHDMFAPWLSARITEDDLCALVTEEVAEIAQQADLDEAAWPTTVEVTAGNASFDVLAEAKAREAATGYGEAFPEELTAESFCRWVQVRLADDETGEGRNVPVLADWVRLWIAVARCETGLCVGHLELEV